LGTLQRFLRFFGPADRPRPLYGLPHCRLAPPRPPPQISQGLAGLLVRLPVELGPFPGDPPGPRWPQEFLNRNAVGQAHLG
jgi:hypothetical protein